MLSLLISNALHAILNEQDAESALKLLMVQ